MAKHKLHIATLVLMDSALKRRGGMIHLLSQGVVDQHHDQASAAKRPE